MSPTSLRLAVASSLLTLAACAGGPTTPTDTTAATGPATFQITNPAALVRASADDVGSIGNFRVKPAPQDDGAIHVVVGDPVTVNANDYRSSYPGVALYLIANWGDGGGNQRVGCGPCRLAHAYETPGRYKLELTVDDGITPPVSAQSPETQVVTVIVTGVPEKPEPAPPVVIPGGRPSATWTSISVSCGPLTTTVTMRVTDPDNDASLFTVGVTGGTLTSAPSGGPVPSGGTFTINFTGTQGLNVVRVDLTDTQGVASQPVSRFGPSNTCGGQILQILG
jgi:hypothetical protein